MAAATYRAACRRWPKAKITLRQGARVVELVSETAGAIAAAAGGGDRSPSRGSLGPAPSAPLGGALNSEAFVLI